MPNESAAICEPGGLDAPFEFDFGESVQLLWAPAVALVKGQFRSINSDDQFLIQYVDGNGVLVTHFVFGDAIDHIGVAA